MGGIQCLLGGNHGILLGPRQLVVVSRAWNCVDVKVELMMAEAAKGAVIRGLVYCGMRRMVHMAVGGGSVSVARLVHETASGQVGPKTSAGLPVGRPPGAVGMTVRQPQVGACFRCRKPGHWKNECPDGGGVGAQGCFTCG